MNTVHQDPEVAVCGYRALAEFPEVDHKVTLLPEAVSKAPAFSPSVLLLDIKEELTNFEAHVEVGWPHEKNR